MTAKSGTTVRNSSWLVLLCSCLDWPCTVYFDPGERFSRDL
jgi:hypothetical protein